MTTHLFPFPNVFQSVRRDGSLIPWPPVCQKCSDRPCESAQTVGIALCSYGMNYCRVDKNMLIAGIVVRDYPQHSPARRKRCQDYRADLVPSAFVQRAVDAHLAQTGKEREQFDEEKQKLIRNYVEREQFKVDFLNPLREEITKGLSFVHDYRQINVQIGQNINVVLESRYPGLSTEDKLTRALPAEKAIYEASKFLEEKLNVAKFLLHPDWLYQRDRCVTFRVHGLVTKYIKIYESQYKFKEVELSVSGSSYKDTIAHPEACAVIPHTLIDNALKYSQPRGKVEVYLKDEDEGVYLSVSSYGPLLLPGEESRIFEPFYRGVGAKQLVEEGAGYGLYVSQLVATEHLGTKIVVEQDSSRHDWRGYHTTFGIIFPPKAKTLF